MSDREEDRSTPRPCDHSDELKLDDLLRLSCHVDNSPLGVIIWDREGRVRRWSHRAEEIFGWPAATTLGRTWGDWRFVHEGDVPDVERRIRRLYDGEQPYNVIENRNYDSLGRVLWCRWYNSALLNDEGAIVSILSQVENVTRYKYDEFRYRGVFQNMPDGLAVYRWNERDDDFVFSDFNPSAERITRVGKADVLGRPLLECFPGMREFGLVDALRRALDGDGPVDLPPRFYRDEQREGWRQNRVYLLPTGEVAAIFADVTRQMQAEEELRQARDRAQDASRAKTEFLANMSHEIRTPLNGLAGLLQLLEMTSLDGEQLGYVRSALGSTRRLSRLLADILDISRIEAGRLIIREEWFDLHETLHAVRDLLTPTAEEKELRFRCVIHPGTPERIYGDPVRLQQVLFNLAANAVKFTADGEVRLEASLSGGSGRPRVLFLVSDTGMGIEPDKLAELFQPFTQGERAYTRSYGGAGLGLAIVKRLTELMGATMAVSSAGGEGVRVFVSLPLRTEPDAPADSQEA